MFFVCLFVLFIFMSFKVGVKACLFPFPFSLLGTFRIFLSLSQVSWRRQKVTRHHQECLWLQQMTVPECPPLSQIFTGRLWLSPWWPLFKLSFRDVARRKTRPIVELWTLRMMTLRKTSRISCPSFAAWSPPASHYQLLIEKGQCNQGEKYRLFYFEIRKEKLIFFM